VPDMNPGDQIDSEWWPESVTVTENTDQLDVSSASFTAGSPECSTTFVAPRSGRVGVCVAAEMRNDSTGGLRILVTFEIRLGTVAGAVHTAALIQRGVSTTGDTTASQFMTHGNMTMVELLTPGATYFIRTMHRVDGGAVNDIGHRRLVVIPLP
jgi:hypothetical protein